MDNLDNNTLNEIMVFVGNTSAISQTCKRLYHLVNSSATLRVKKYKCLSHAIRNLDYECVDIYIDGMREYCIDDEMIAGSIKRAFKDCVKNGSVGMVEHLACRQNLFDLDYVCYLSVRHGAIDIIECFINKYDIEWSPSFSFLPISVGDVKFVSTCIKSGYEIVKCACDIAIEHGHFEMFKLLIKNGYMPHTDPHCRTCSILSMSYVKCLIDAGLPLDNSLYHHAAAIGNIEIIRLMVDYDVPFSGHACTFAVSNGQFECLKFLHSRGFQWDCSTMSVAIDMVSKNKHEGSAHMLCLKYLCENDCPVDDVDVDTLKAIK